MFHMQLVDAVSISDLIGRHILEFQQERVGLMVKTLWRPSLISSLQLSDVLMWCLFRS